MNEPPPKAPRPGSLGGNPAGTHGRGCSLPARPPAAGLQREELGARVHGSQGPPAAAGAAPQHHHGGAAGPPGGAAPTEAAPRPAADPSASHGALHPPPPPFLPSSARLPLPALTEGRPSPALLNFFFFFEVFFKSLPAEGYRRQAQHRLSLLAGGKRRVPPPQAGAASSRAPRPPSGGSLRSPAPFPSTGNLPPEHGGAG